MLSYKWVSSKPETVRVYPLSALSPPALLPLSSCSQQCLVSALSSPQAVPIRTVVQAQDPVTGHILRCDVIIDCIERIKIITTARQLFTDDPPLQLTVQAFDSEGNTFSSLAGLKFNWWLAKESDAIQAVRFVRHHDAGYVPPPHILSLEDVGQRGESVLLYGIHSGSALVKVSFLHSEHKHVEAASVTLFVIDRLHLSPAGDTYLLQGSTIRYSLWKTEQEGETEVTFSEKEYSLVVDGFRGRMCHHDIICVEWETATVTAFKSGHATLTVAHNNMPPEIMSQLPRTSVYVVKPSYMTLSIEEEEDRWVLETGRQYYLTIRIHESKGHVVHLSQNVVIVVEETEGLVTFESLSDPSCRLMQTIMKGKTLIQASLYSTISKDGEEWPVIPPIRVRQEVEIYNPLTLQPSLVVFPWQPHNKLYQHNIQVEGGSGSVKWKVSDSGIATVTVKGVVLAGKRRGQAEIQVSDSKNILHKVVGKVMVVRPGRLQLIPQRGDCRVGDRIDIPLALWGIQDPPNTCSETHYVFDTHSNTPRSTSINSQANFFSDTQNPQCGETLLEDRNLVAVTDCSQLSLHVHTEPSGIFTHMSGSLSPGAEFCGGVRMEALSQGHAVVTITVITEACNISETATLVAYSPLKSLVSEVLLTVGSSRVVIFEGGPQPWPPAPFRFYSDIEVHPTGSVTVEALSSTEARTPRHVYQIMCTAVGKQWLVFRCGNTPGPFNENPAVEESRVHVACGIPVSLLLSATSFPSSPSSIPLFSHHYSCAQPQYPCGLLSVSSTRDATLHLSVFDQKGVQFDNFTSCSMRWSSSDPGLLSLGPQSTTAADRPTQTGNKLHVWQVLQTHRQTGTVTVDVTLTCPEMLTAPESQCVNLRLVDDVQWARHSVTLFNHPKVTENMTLIHGSGHFHAHLQDNQLASINHMKNGNIIQVSPLRPGFSTLLAHDLCLTSDPAVASILVSDITDFQIDFINIIEVRHSAVVRVCVLDSKKQPFLHHFLLLMNLLLIPSSSIISVEEAEPVDEYSMGFHVTGLAVGVVSLHLSAVDGHGRVISSSHKNMQVYPPFSFQPRKLSLAVGSVQQVKLEGGPYPQSSVRFSVSDSSIAVVTETGLVRGMAVGVVKLRGALQTHDTEAPLTFVQDEVEVEVFNLTAVRIQAPLVTLSVGTEMPVYVMGRDSSQNPLSLGSIESGLRFHWSLAKPCVLEIKPRHAQVGVSVSPSHSFSVLVRAEAPGRTSLKVIVQLEEIHTSNALFSDHLTDEIQILVFEEMQLTTGTSGSILMSPLSQYTLQSNKDSICTVHYTLSRCVSGVGLVTVDDQGMLRTGPDTGVALLEVFAMDICGINQTLFITVKVSTVWFVRVLTVSSVNSDDERALPAFPLGWSIHTKALYYDNMGQQFHSHNMQTLVTTNRDDLVQLIVDKDNQSFLVQTVSPGLTVLRVQGDPINPFLSDYTPLFVVPAILEPPGFLRPGDIICFSSPIVDQQGRRGRWDVSSSQILQITSETGVAFAKNSGTAVVYYRLDGGQQTFREVTVESASIPVIILPADRLLTNWPEASEYTVRVDLNTSAANIAQCNLDQWEAIENKLHPEAELLCSLYFGAPYLEIRTLQDIFHATPFYNTDFAQYSCRISVQPQSDSLFRLLSTLPLSIYLSACLQTQSAPAALPLHPDSPPSFQSSIWLQYVPAFHCPVTKIKLSSQQPVAEITVFGTTDMLSALRVQSDTPDIVLSHPVRSDENPTLLLIRVYSASHFLDQVPSTANITLYTDLSPQTHVVMVTRVMDSQESGHFGTNVGLLFILIFALFAVLATTAALFIAYNTMLSLTQNVPAVLTSSTNTEENKKHFYLWITPSLPTQKVLQRKQWLWKTN